MAKIDLEKLICSLSKRKYLSEEKLQDALKEQGLEYKDGEIVESQRPKFHEGEWIVDEHGDSFIINSIERGFYFTQLSGCCYQTPLDIDLVDNSYHAWTIEDAKACDVLVDVYGNIGIFEKHDDFDWTSYCSLGVRGGFQSFKVEHENGNACPANNAQRHTLFAKMKEAGYTFAFDKKELKPIDNRFDYEHANIQQKDFATKATTANRQLYNRAILAILSNYVEKYPDIRFGQMLYNLGVNPHFDEESRETYCNLNETINKSKDESKN